MFIASGLWAVNITVWFIIRINWVVDRSLNLDNCKELYGLVKYFLSKWASHQLSWLSDTWRARYMFKHSTLAKCFRDWDNNILANCQPRPRQSWVGIPSEMLTAQRRVVDQQKGYYVGLITFFSLLIVLVVAISELIKYALIKREGLSREKNWVSKIKILLKNVLEVPYS